MHICFFFLTNKSFRITLNYLFIFFCISSFSVQSVDVLQQQRHGYSQSTSQPASQPATPHDLQTQAQASTLVYLSDLNQTRIVAKFRPEFLAKPVPSPLHSIPIASSRGFHECFYELYKYSSSA
ncbi:hypothetical protein E2C01_079737 [Portunus trituberculatus]|uniref:Uncharacterized protein n=1 Tax=Portunus trituberculatus TaxID=210409 RepID=A0A5B7IKB3_PORTR|nr:hypothetical protein [Portunus trituberculatus]